MIELRPNQTEPVAKAIDFFQQKRPRPSLIVLPTAWGKSLLTAFVARACRDKLIVLQPSKELLEQNYAKYQALCGGMGLDAGIYSASFGRKEIAPVTYATIGSIKSLGSKFKQLGYTKMLIDEAHLYPREADSMLGRFLKESGITHVLGITATPIKLQTNRDEAGNVYSKLVMLTSRSKKGNFFKEIIHVGQTEEMVRLGYWSPLAYRAAEFDRSRLVFNSNRSEYTEASVRAAYDANGGDRRIIEALDANPDRRHILVFVPSVETAKSLAALYPDSAVIHGKMGKRERADVIARFRAGGVRVIFNVRVLSTGFDYTGIDCIVLGISTASVALYYQIIGRATRIDPCKRDALIIDLGGNVERFGRVEDITYEHGREWRMFGTGGQLLSGVPMASFNLYSRNNAQRADARPVKPLAVMPFGKHKGVKLADIPLSYKQWMLRTFTWDGRNENLRQGIMATL